jgi:hypothetical protein
MNAVGEALACGGALGPYLAMNRDAANRRFTPRAAVVSVPFIWLLPGMRKKKFRVLRQIPALL